MNQRSSHGFTHTPMMSSLFARIRDKCKTMLAARKGKQYTFDRNNTHGTTSSLVSGFTLIETLVAIAVLTIAIVGPYSIANTAIVASRTTQNELVASYLAQEALEFVRIVRDGNLAIRLSGEDSSISAFAYLDACIGKTCSVDSRSFLRETCPTYGGAYVCPPMYLDEDGIYNQEEEGEETIFTRSVSMTDNYGYLYTHEATVTITVTWTERGGTRSYVLEETLYDWLGYAN